jgi:hypothetical protein
MKIELDIQASDTEPGVVVLSVTDTDSRVIVIPLKGDDLQRFTVVFATALVTAFADQAMAAIAAIDQELISREHTDDAG